MRGFEVISKYKDAGIELPVRKTAASAGYDLAAAEDVELLPGKVTIIPTGLKAYMAVSYTHLTLPTICSV